jgi:hypothetical protein
VCILKFEKPWLVCNTTMWIMDSSQRRFWGVGVRWGEKEEEEAMEEKEKGKGGMDRGKERERGGRVTIVTVFGDSPLVGAPRGLSH